MYDELIKRLRETSIDFGESDHVSVMLIEAADAIEDLWQALDTAQGVLAEQPSMWIPVTERLPELNTVVQITDWIDVGHGYLASITSTQNMVYPSWHSPFCDVDETHITHWMPLPQPPKEET